MTPLYKSTDRALFSVMISSLTSRVLSSNLGLATNTFVEITHSLYTDLVGQLSDTDKSMNTESTDEAISVI